MSRDQTLAGYTVAQPEWCGDFLGRDQLVPGGAKVDPTQFPTYPAVAVTLTAPAAVGAAAITVAALTGAIRPGTMLNFGNPGKLAFAPNGAAAAATSIVTAPLARALITGDTTTTDANTHAVVPSGTVLGRTFAQRNAGTPLHLALDTDEEIFLVAFEVPNVNRVNDVALVRPRAGVVVKENFLPNFSTLSATIKAALRAQYLCTVGAP
jgi:hypothetical protein